MAEPEIPLDTVPAPVPPPPPLTVAGLFFEQWLPQVLCNWCGDRTDGKKCGAQAWVAGVLPPGHRWNTEPPGVPRYMALCILHLPAWQKHTETDRTISMVELFRHIARTLCAEENAGNGPTEEPTDG